MSTLITYKGLKKLSTTPTGVAGQALNDNFTYLADAIETHTNNIASKLDVSGGELTGDLLIDSTLQVVGTVQVSSDISTTGIIYADNGLAMLDGANNASISIAAGDNCVLVSAPLIASGRSIFESMGILSDVWVVNSDGSQYVGADNANGAVSMYPSNSTNRLNISADLGSFSYLNIFTIANDGSLTSGINGSPRIVTNNTGLSFFGATPIGQRPQTNDLRTSLIQYGLIAGTSGATPLNLNGGTLTAGSASLTSATLTSASLTSATISTASLTSATITNASLSTATLTSATLTNASLTTATIANATISTSITLPTGAIAETALASSIKNALNGSHPGLISSEDYGAPGFSSGGNAGGVTSNTLYAVCIEVPYDCTIASIGVYQQSSGSTGNVHRVSLYSNNAGKPGTKVADSGTMAADTGGGTTKYGAVNVAVTRGWYWLAYSGNSTGNCWNFGTSLSGIAPVTAGGLNAWKQTASAAPTSAHPSTFGSCTRDYATNTCPILLWKI